ncbi:hypothetical protein [Mesorhizobium sp.]|uniref:hypothetical protein n=1 Tax=Mesorhizobium sp. TaxID=1871066 RepID=UPI000FE47BC3|nr:hypothetical protein [Mesorhizobium sp.]RWH31601.1 MAG: hypothetical protein EOQ76_07235 [Mesorhizobium sp.]TIR57654.1 MAG: hypothetical protein E5X22_22785 [Mesorhizobium sp.]
MTSPFGRFTSAEVKEMLRGAGLPDDLDDGNVRALGLVRIRTQREKVLAAYDADPSVDAIFAKLRGEVPKSSIRAYLCRAFPNGEWRVRSRRGSGRAA